MPAILTGRSHDITASARRRLSG